jgi:hypothetical protein
MGTANMLLGAAGPFLFFRTISSDQVDYNLYNQMIAAGWDGQRPVVVNLTINGGVVIYSSSTAVYAFTVSNIPANSSIVITNNGYIVGKGGTGIGKGYPNQTDYNLTPPAYANGGTAFFTNYPTSIDNLNGTVGGGGGGGGVGGATAADCSCSSCGGVELNGMAPGGGGAGFGTGGLGYTNWRNNTGYRLSLVSGSNGGLTTGGGSGGSGTGATGGGLGQGGGTGGGSSRCGYTDQSGPGTGGAAGACTQGNSNITWINTGIRLGVLN